MKPNYRCWNWILRCLFVWVLAAGGAAALRGGTLPARLADPAVDAFNIRVGTQTFAGRYQFTTNTLLVETAEAIRGMGSDVIKFYLGKGFNTQYRIPLTSSITSLTALARDEPSCRRVLDMPFRHMVMWAYCFSTGGDAYWADGLSASERQKEYAEMYNLSRHLLTTYNDTGKSFYLGHWEGDWYLLPGYATTNNPTAAAIQGMRDWLNTRQQAVDDAMRDTPHTNVQVYAYAEVNRVRDAMLNGPASNQRVVNKVLPAVTNLDFVSWSSYDGQDLSSYELTRTLNYIESQLSTNKASIIPGKRVIIGEYGWGGTLSSAAQEPRTRAYIRNLLSWSPRFILFWEIYNNEPDRSYWLIDTNGVKTPCWQLHSRYANLARLKAALFKQDNNRLPTDGEFSAITSPSLTVALAQPVALKVRNGTAANTSSGSARLEGSVEQGIYGDEQAVVWLYWGRSDGGTNAGSWENAQNLGVNTRFGLSVFGTVVENLKPGAEYFYRFHAVNSTAAVWASETSTFKTAAAAPRLKGAMSGGRFMLGLEDGAAFDGLFQVQAADDLGIPTEWRTVFATNAGFSSFQWTDIDTNRFYQRFYRVVLGP